MRITCLGQAGFYLETERGSILCDPWFNPAYFASWIPFPSNERIDPQSLSTPDYLYVSHMHYDHFDPEWLREHVSKETTVLLPDYPLDLLEKALRECGFTKFVKTKNYEWVELPTGLRVAITAAVAPIDGPLGDSGLVVDDGQVKIFNQNDSRPMDIDALAALGPFDAHFLQYSGAIWYPMVYQYPPKMLDVLGRKKRENEMARAVRYIKEVGATFIIPSAGPPCFLDDGLFELNDFDRDPANTFPDATVFLDYMHEHGYDNGRLMIPGTVATLTREACTVAHPVPDDELLAIFREKRAYLEAFKARQQPRIDAIKASWPRGKYDILAELKAWFEPLLQEADILAVGINGLVVLDLGASGVVLDFHTRTVYAWEGQEWDYYFKVDPALIEAEIEKRQPDWVNDLFLSCRFEAGRKGAYNEYVYIFFKCLTEERLQYAEGYYAEKVPEQQFFEAHGYRIQRRCPHLKADLDRFAIIDENHILTCTMHGWQFDLETGKCLTSDDRHLYTQKLDTPALPAEAAAQMDMGPARLMRDRCHDCWYDAKKFKRTPAGAAKGEGAGEA